MTHAGFVPSTVGTPHLAVLPAVLNPLSQAPSTQTPGRAQNVEPPILDSKTPIVQITEPQGGSTCWIRPGVWATVPYRPRTRKRQLDSFGMRASGFPKWPLSRSLVGPQGLPRKLCLLKKGCIISTWTPKICKN